MLALAACGAETDSTANQCTDPPADQLEVSTNITLSLSPDTVEAGSEADLSVKADGLGADQPIVGAAVMWQCWDGTAWVDTHQVLRGRYGDYRVATLDPGVEVTMPAVGLLVPNTFTIQIPSVPPGVYRIADSVSADGGQRFTATVIVRVT
jgi:hypothetical protein